MEVFEKSYLGNCELSNRIIRSGTFEGMCDEKGIPSEEYLSFYKILAENNIGAIITGFSYISDEGKAMQPGQAGIYSSELVPHFKKVTDAIHRSKSRIFMQLAHTGRQTRQKDTGKEVVGASGKRSIYFKGNPRGLSTDEAYRIVEKFGDSALYAMQAGFDGVQIHAAHGYLIHQFILPSVNNRKDIFGIHKEIKIGTEFLNQVIDNVRQKCGKNFPLLVKISGGDDYFNAFSERQFINLVQFFDQKAIDGIEVSYGTMDYALNIFRGDIPVDLILRKNDIYRIENRLGRRLWKTFIFPGIRRKFISFSPMYNLKYAVLAKQYTNIPIISVGGFRALKEIKYAIQEKKIDFVSLSRPFICEPDFVNKMIMDNHYISKCNNCNFCVIMCDTENITKCYK